uniref:DUF7794 domain-containing protein n=1 Tax=Chlamydomonas euryale TaxID=1486919 RepID=A0A7R9W1R6_9CHLO|mmetsp:Transcript_9803/g.29657  ORF Transcript_9803/g.29657 Transcript_9803/m.29657 type:complete len:362 (+) Transcript_9803:82-1167(+)
MSPTWSLVLLALLALARLAASSSVLLVDSHDGSYLHSSTEEVYMDVGSLSSVLSALSGLFPTRDVDVGTVDRLVRPSPLRKPRAHVVINVASLSHDELAEIFGHRQARKVTLQQQAATTVETVSEMLSEIAFSNSELRVTMLDHQGFMACSGNCLDEHMEAATAGMGAVVSGSVITLPGGEQLRLDHLPDKLFAVEAASLHSGVEAHLHGIDGGSAPSLLEITLVGLHGLEEAYTRDSAVAAAARSSLLAMLKALVAKIDAAYGGDVTYQVAGFQVPAEVTVSEVMDWKTSARRRLAADAAKADEPWPPADQAAASKTFSTKAAAYCTFLLMLYFSLAAVWCMCNMPFKPDTMLFGAKKYE